MHIESREREWRAAVPTLFQIREAASPLNRICDESWLASFLLSSRPPFLQGCLNLEATQPEYRYDRDSRIFCWPFLCNQCHNKTGSRPWKGHARRKTLIAHPPISPPDIYPQKQESSIFWSFILPCTWFLEVCSQIAESLTSSIMNRPHLQRSCNIALTVKFYYKCEVAKIFAYFTGTYDFSENATLLL